MKAAEEQKKIESLQQILALEEEKAVKKSS
jgi:hypothetical protein